MFSPKEFDGFFSNVVFPALFLVVCTIAAIPPILYIASWYFKLWGYTFYE